MRIAGLAVAMVMVLTGMESAKAADPPPPGFVADDLAVGKTTPLYVVSKQASVRPQIAYLWGGIPSVYGGPYQGMTMMQSVGVNLAGGLIAGALINAAEREAAEQAAEESWRWMQTGKCVADADAPVRTALESALQQAGINTPAQTLVLEGRDLDEVITDKGERLIVQHSTSFTPDMQTVLTSVLVSGWGPQNADGKAQKRPRWQNLLMTASAPLALQAKTEQDTAVLLRAAQQAYADSGNEARIAKVNAARQGADKTERRLALDTLRRHTRIQREAKQENWNEGIESMRRAIYWTDNQCALLNQAVQDNAAEAARLLQAMLSEQLPSSSDVVNSPAFTGSADQPAGMIYERTGPREVAAIGASFHLSRLVGVRVPTAYFDNVLDGESAKD